MTGGSLGIEEGTGGRELTIHADGGDGFTLYAQGIVSSPASEFVSWYLFPCYSRCPWGVILESPNCWSSKGYCEETGHINISAVPRGPSLILQHHFLPNSSVNPQTEGAAANPPGNTAVTVTR